MYYLRNDGQRQQLDLRFISGSPLLRVEQGGSDSLQGTFEVQLDERPVGSLRIDSMLAPAEWLPPAQTPGIDDNERLSYEVQLRLDNRRDNQDSLSSTSIPVVAFTIDLPPGLHTLRVHYQTLASSHSEISDAINWQIAYILAPVRRWGSFGELDARVILPEDWLAATEPLMDRQGDTLIAKWKGIPSDALSITTRMSLPFWVPFIDRAVAIISAILATLLSRLLVQWLVRRLQIPRWTLVPIAIVLGLIVVGILTFGYTIGFDWYAQMLGEQIGRGYNYLRGIGFLFLMMPITAVGTFIITLKAGRQTFDQQSNAGVTKPTVE
jgi:hypothetical protein